METIVATSQVSHAIIEDSSDRSDESSTMSQEYQSRGSDDYTTVKSFKVSVGERFATRDDLQNIPRSKDYHLTVERNVDSNEQSDKNIPQFDDSHDRELSLNLGKTTEYDYPTGRITDDALNYNTERKNDNEVTIETSLKCRSRETTMKGTFFNLAAKQKYLSSSFDRTPKEFNYLVDREIKQYGIAKGYNLSLDRMKEFSMSHERTRENHTNGLTVRERLNGAVVNHDINDQRNSHGQSRSPQDIESIVYEGMRRPHHHFLNRMDFAGQNLTNTSNLRQTNVNQFQQSQREQQQQQQIKSFTIDAILAHRNNQRERHQRNQQQQLRKPARTVRQECREGTAKSGILFGRSTDTSVNDVSGVVNDVGGVVNSGKAKRVRTIFTAEQLERLEAEFARQQYMVGPERLYLAHALRLTEAQVKVWFQNRRIKWRKVNHEQQCQAVSEHRQRCSLPPGTLEIHEDDSNDTSGGVNWCAITATTNTGDDSSLINASNQHQHVTRDSSIVKS